VCQATLHSNPQHVLVELHEGQLRVSAEVHSETVVINLPLTTSPSGALEDRILVYIDPLSLRVTQNTVECITLGCLSSTTPLTPLSSNSSLSLDGSVYIGGVPQWTEYMRAKAKSTTGFRGCLGVSKSNYF